MTTRGELAAHVESCPQRPVTCAAAAVGCAWAGMLGEQAAHEGACQHVLMQRVCERMVTPLREETERLRSCVEAQQAKNGRLRSRTAALEPLEARLAALENQHLNQLENQKRLCAENQRLHTRVEALELLEARVFVKETHLPQEIPPMTRVEPAEEEGRRVGGAARDAPSDEAIRRMGVA